MGEPQRWQDAPPSHDASLRIFDHSSLLREEASTGGPGELSAGMTVGQIWTRYYKPIHLVTQDSRPRNQESIERSVEYWIEFTGDPPINQISYVHTGAFVAGLRKLRGRKYETLGNNTIRKHCGAIQAILDLCGPPDRTHRDCLGLLDRVPYVARPPREEKPAEDCYTLTELARLVENADAATLPKKIGGMPIAPGTYHRRIYALIFNTGLRITGVMQTTWKHFHGDHLWLVPRVAVKGRVGKRVELNEAAQRIVESMRGFDAERIFPWPRKWPASSHNLYDEHDLIRQCLPPERRTFMAYHALRKLHNNELAAINGLACMKSLGHASGKTTVEHYTSRTVVAKAVAQLPDVPIDDDPQRRLFD